MGGKPASWSLGVVLENPGGADFKARDLQDFVVLQAVRWGPESSYPLLRNKTVVFD